MNMNILMMMTRSMENVLNGRSMAAMLLNIPQNIPWNMPQNLNVQIFLGKLLMQNGGSSNAFDLQFSLRPHPLHLPATLTLPTRASKYFST